MVIEAKIRKWGSSKGIILPKDFIENHNLKENDKVLINIVKEANVSHLYGKLKNKKGLSGQDLKDSSKEEW